MLTIAQAKAFAAELDRIAAAYEQSVADAENGQPIAEAAAAVAFLTEAMIGLAGRVTAATDRLNRLARTSPN